MARRRRKSAAKKPAPVKAPRSAKPAVTPSPKFWVPPSVRDGGPKTPTRKNAPKQAKFWTPEQLGLTERTDRALPEKKGAGIPFRVVEQLGEVRLVWYGGRRPHGLVVTNFPLHEIRISVHRADSKVLYSDPLLAMIDSKGSKGEPGGWCDTCESDDCKGVRWAFEKLYKRNPLPF